MNPSPLLIAHRGASGFLPEHTLEAYMLAIRQGADIIEPDVVLTRDGVMVVRHEPMLDETTDVAARFPSTRRTTKILDGVETTAYFASDFTLAEIKTLRAKQARPGRSQADDGRFEIPTLAEVILCAQKAGETTRRPIGIYPEIKHGAFHAHVAGFGSHYFEDLLLQAVALAFGHTPEAPVFIQSFEAENLRYLSSKTQIPLVQLVDATHADTHLTLEGLNRVAHYAQVIAPWKKLLQDDLIARAHALGLAVHTWTFRDDDLDTRFANPIDEIRHYINAGIDGFFTDFPPTGVLARRL